MKKIEDGQVKLEEAEEKVKKTPKAKTEKKVLPEKETKSQ